MSRHAGQDARKHYAALFVAVQEETRRIIGYYTLSNASVILQNIPETLRKKFPRYPEVPAVRLGCLAVDLCAQGFGLGSELLGDAVIRSVSNVTAWAVMIVEAKNERARDFYLRFGFDSLLDDKMRMFAVRHDLETFFHENS